MGRDCLWDSEEQDWEWTAQLICSSFWYGTRLPLGRRGAKQRIDSSADLLLVFVWDKTVSGTARSKTKSGLPGWSAPRYCMGQNCLWDGKEPKIYVLNSWSAPRFSMGQNCLWDGEEQDDRKLWISLAVWDWEDLPTIMGTARSKTK